MIRKRYALASAAVAALALGGSATAGAVPQDLEVVKGNNGTVKAEVVGSGCQVTLDWYGMDASALSFVTFELHGGSGDALLLLDAEVLDPDGAYGGDLDGSRTYDLGPAVATFGDPTADSHQVKVTTHTTYSQGADTKYKVISVSNCEDGGGTSGS